MKHRTVLKWVHWLSAGLILYFLLVEPEENRADPGAALSAHAGVGMLLALTVALYLRKGLAGRPGPKLPGWGKGFHRLSHLALQWGVPVVVLTGALSGLAAPFVIRAFGLLPINPGFGAKGVHGFFEEIHEFAFDALLVGIVLHALFHVWRHVRLKDNALRIMTPKALYKYL